MVITLYFPRQKIWSQLHLIEIKKQPDSYSLALGIIIDNSGKLLKIQIHKETIDVDILQFVICNLTFYNL